MHISRVDLNLFTVFDAIYSEGSVSAAARKLHLTQPAVSHALARLRELIKDPLFERKGHKMVSTSVARSLIEPVRLALHALAVGLAERDHFDPMTSERAFVLAMRDVIESACLPTLMQHICTTPKIDLAASRIPRRELVSQFSSGNVDAAVDVLIPLPDEIRRTRIAREPTIVVARAGHPAVLDGTLSLETYLAQSHVLVSSRLRGPGIEDVELSRLGHTRRVRLRCQHFFAACKVVSETDMFLTMPERYARAMNEQFGNLLLPVPFGIPLWDIYLYWHQSMDQDPANQWLRGQISNAFLSAR